MTEKEYGRALDVAMKAGALLLESGAEIRRVEDTVIRIASHFGMSIQATMYSLTNALFITAEIPEEHISFSRILQVPMKRMRINHLIHINQFSRDLAVNRYSLEEAEAKIEEISAEKDTPGFVRIIAACIASFAFTLLFGGNFYEALFGALGGTAAFVFASWPGSRISKIITNFTGGMILSLIALHAPIIFPALTLDPTTIMLGAIMPLVPGVSFMNSFRDIANGDYLSGTVRFLDAVLIGVSLATGAAVVLKVITMVRGGGL